MNKYETLFTYIKNCGKETAILSFDEIEDVQGFPLDHSFLQYKKELYRYGYEVKKISMKEKKVVFEKTLNDTLVLYIHGKDGSIQEAERYKPLFPRYNVVGVDYRAKTPWEAKSEFLSEFQLLSDKYSNVILIANSIGAYFSMCSLPQEKIKKAYFISPIADMEKLIKKMMTWANVSEKELFEKETIKTSFGETLSWKYLCFVRDNPVDWKVYTEILYGENDRLTDVETITAFANAHAGKLTVMKNGEHWFHTAEQMKFLDDWIKKGEGN